MVLYLGKMMFYSLRAFLARSAGCDTGSFGITDATAGLGDSSLA